MIGWAIFGMVTNAIIVLFIPMFVQMNIGDMARYIKISSM